MTEKTLTERLTDLAFWHAQQGEAARREYGRRLKSNRRLIKQRAEFHEDAAQMLREIADDVSAVTITWAREA